MDSHILKDVSFELFSTCALRDRQDEGIDFLKLGCVPGTSVARPVGGKNLTTYHMVFFRELYSITPITCQLVEYLTWVEG